MPSVVRVGIHNLGLVCRDSTGEFGIDQIRVFGKVIFPI